jgi:tetratricopeptide (TPR) repeat protein
MTNQADMAMTIAELVDKAIDQRCRGRHAEALLSAIAATELESDNATAWWQVSLNRWMLGDAKLAIVALERTVELAPHFAPAWARLGTARLKSGDKSDAFRAFKTALDCEAENEEALRGAVEALVDFEKNDPSRADPELLLSVLTRLEQIGKLSGFQLNKLGILHYNNNSYYDAINYWKRSTASSNDPASLFNLGLVYNDPDVAQTADAIDMWRLTLIRFPDHKRSQESLSKAVPAALAQAEAARSFNDKHLLPEDQWYVHYLNPLEFLNCPSDVELDGLDARALKGFKDKLLKEIELEDGVVAWMPGTRFDKSKAISASEELTDDIKREYHWHVFRNPLLLDFLSRGGFEHFLVNEASSPIEIIELLDDESEGFREWLSEPFAKQFDLVLSKAIDRRNTTLITCLLAGRRWIAPSFTDACFQSTRRQIDRLLQPLRDAGGRATEINPSVESVKALLDENSLLHLLNSLPVYFRDYQDETANIIRDIAHTAFAKHSDIELVKAILQVSNQLQKISANVRGYIEEDFKQIDEIIQRERESEARLTSGDTKWEITKRGALLGSQNIPADKVTALRWGTFITRQSNGAPTYDFLLAVKDGNGTEIRYSWQASRDIEKSEKYFNQLTAAALDYLFPVIVERIEGLLKAGKPVRIGPCSVTESGITFQTKGWFSNNENTVPWVRLGINIVNGDLTVFDKASEKTKTSMTLRTTDNATVLHFLAQVRNQTEG